jgi:hypothetical protein
MCFDRSSYSDEDMQLAYNKVTSEGWSVARAAREMGVPRVTLLNKISGLHKTGRIGRPTALTEVEESVLVDLLVLMGDYNYPISKRDLREMIKNYLDRRDRTDTGYGVFEEKLLKLLLFQVPFICNPDPNHLTPSSALCLLLNGLRTFSSKIMSALQVHRKPTWQKVGAQVPRKTQGQDRHPQGNKHQEVPGSRQP